MTRTGPLFCRFEWPSFCPVFENIPEMPFVPWAWTSFPVEPENGIAGLAIRGRIGRIWDTVFFGALAGTARSMVKVTLKSGPFAAPDYPSGHPFSGILCQNRCSFTHFFRNHHILAIYGNPGILRGCTKRFCTLLGGKSQGRMEWSRAQ